MSGRLLCQREIAGLCECVCMYIQGLAAESLVLPAVFYTCRWYCAPPVNQSQRKKTAIALMVGVSCPSCVLTVSSQAAPQERVHFVAPRHFRGSSRNCHICSAILASISLFARHLNMLCDSCDSLTLECLLMTLGLVARAAGSSQL